MQVRTRPWSLLLAALALCCRGPIAQTYVVDAAGGAGSHFRTLVDAAAAVPDGAVLRVRPGVYELFPIESKGLSVIGDDAAAVVIDAPLARLVGKWGPTTAAQPLRIAHVTFRASLFLTQAMVDVSGARGSVTFDDVHIDPADSSQSVTFRFTDCSDVHFRRCQLTNTGSWSSLWAANDSRVRAVRTRLEISDCTIQGPGARGVGTAYGGHGIRVEDGRLTLVASTVSGGAGSWCSAPKTTSSPGGQGLILTRSTLVALAARITGGPSGHVFFCFTPPFPPGGDGLHVVGQSAASLYATILAGGTALAPALPGLPSVVERGSTLYDEPAATPALARVTGTPARNAVVQLGVDALPGSGAALLLGTETHQTPLEPLAVGTLLVSSFATFGPFVLPVNGQLRVPVTLPATLPLDLAIQGQAVTLEPVSLRVWASNSFAVLARS